jgi:NAD(P)-dependent dehydrogenase (short-subunit alcohol dehydrogenase family)
LKIISLNKSLYLYVSISGSKFALEGIMDSLRYVLAQFDIPITNVNAGPTVKTAFLQKFAANRGTREAPMDEKQVLNRMTDHYIDMIGRLMANPDVQSSSSVAEVMDVLMSDKIGSYDVNIVEFE